MTHNEKTKNTCTYFENIWLMLPVWSVKMLIFILNARNHATYYHIAELEAFLQTKQLTLAKRFRNTRFLSFHFSHLLPFCGLCHEVTVKVWRKIWSYVPMYWRFAFMWKNAQGGFWGLLVCCSGQFSEHILQFSACY